MGFFDFVPGYTKPFFQELYIVNMRWQLIKDKPPKCFFAEWLQCQLQMQRVIFFTLREIRAHIIRRSANSG